MCKNLIDQCTAVDLNGLYRYAERLGCLRKRHVIQEHVATVAQHIGRDQHPLAQILALELCDQILTGDQSGHRDTMAKEIVLDRIYRYS